MAGTGLMAIQRKSEDRGGAPGISDCLVCKWAVDLQAHCFTSCPHPSIVAVRNKGYDALEVEADRLDPM